MPTRLTKTSWPARCVACGYDLRAISSPRCPECATPRDWQPLLFLDIEVFRRARALLQQAGLLMKEFDPSAGTSGLFLVLAGLEQAGQLWVARERLDQAMELLDKRGIPVTLPAADRGEPTCPLCGAALDPAGAARCNECGGEFDWIESGSPPAVEDAAAAPGVPKAPVIAAIIAICLAIVIATAGAGHSGPALPWASAIAACLGFLGLMTLLLVLVLRVR